MSFVWRWKWTGYHYAVELDLAKPPEAEKYVYGQVKLTLSGLQGFIVNASLHQQRYRFNDCSIRINRKSLFE